jgi:hypothetical protein
MYLRYATQRYTISVLIIVHKQFEKTGQIIGISVGFEISVESRISRTLLVSLIAVYLFVSTGEVDYPDIRDSHGAQLH